jgi:hypothetical protein
MEIGRAATGGRRFFLFAASARLCVTGSVYAFHVAVSPRRRVPHSPCPRVPGRYVLFMSPFPHVAVSAILRVPASPRLPFCVSLNDYANEH